MIRALDPKGDLAAVQDLIERAADHARLETGEDPPPDAAVRFFRDAPPGGDPGTSLRLGAFEGGRAVAVADVVFGFPEAGDAFIGLLLLAPEARGRGLGREMLRDAEGRARSRGATRMLVAVLEANPRGRAFWEREGFGSPRVDPPARIGAREHVRVRLEKPL